MNVGEICSRDVFVVMAGEPLARAVHEMDAGHVGAVVVVEERGGVRKPVGIVTDRDVLTAQFERNADLFCLTVADAMTGNPLTLDAGCGIPAAIELMKRRAVRRAPVVDAAGALMGIVSFDDLLPVAAEQMTQLAHLIGSQSTRESRR